MRQNRRSFSMLSILKMSSIFSGSRGPDGPDLPSPFGWKFQLSVHTLPDDGRSISRNVAEKHYDSRHDKLKNSMNKTESTITNIFKSWTCWKPKWGKFFEHCTNCAILPRPLSRDDFCKNSASLFFHSSAGERPQLYPNKIYIYVAVLSFKKQRCKQKAKCWI